MPSIGVDVLAVQGVSPTDLRAGVGHYPQSSTPCGTGNAAFFGNRVTYGHPFGQLDQMGPGDLIYVQTPTLSCAYRVIPAAQWEPANPHPVLPSDLARFALSSTKQSVLTLVTDTPPGSDAFRLVLRAALDPTAAPSG